MRPKKPRFLAGVQLVDNLYPDPRKRPGFYSYVRPDGTKKSFQAPTVEEANRVAQEANGLRDQYIPTAEIKLSRGMTAYHLPAYIQYREKINAGLKSKHSWRNRKYALKLFAAAFPRLGQIELPQIRTWWDELTHSQQKLRMAEFRRFFNWLMGECLVPRVKYNPFTTADDVARLLLKEKPKKARQVLTEINFHRIHKAAGKLGYTALQLAMDISLYTLLREGDVVRLRFDRHLDDDQLRTVVSKSDAQRGTARATRLCWDLEEHPKLRTLINRARELSLTNKRCPYLVSHKPKRRVWNDEGKDHICQVTPDRLSRMFNESMRACKISGTSFHEVRGLAITLYKRAGYNEKEIQQIAAHESVGTTRGYMDPAELPFEHVQLKM
ncbi:MAG TPA: tyrosine-type recombinase/integrase [Hyphomicrobiales bacterium]|nr:tyrosine-type recombinase/integrase [Hyphomicrobiales bacterium]